MKGFKFIEIESELINLGLVISIYPANDSDIIFAYINNTRAHFHFNNREERDSMLEDIKLQLKDCYDN